MAAVYPEYLSDMDVIFCPSDAEHEEEQFLAEPNGAWLFETAPGSGVFNLSVDRMDGDPRNGQWNELPTNPLYCETSDISYTYLGYVVNDAAWAIPPTAVSTGGQTTLMGGFFEHVAFGPSNQPSINDTLRARDDGTLLQPGHVRTLRSGHHPLTDDVFDLACLHALALRSAHDASDNV